MRMRRGGQRQQISRIKKRQTKAKENWAQLSLEDEKQSITANAFSRVWAQIGGKIEVNQPVIVTGEIRGDELSAKPEIIVSAVEPVISVIARKAKKFIIDLPSAVDDFQLKQLDAHLNAVVGLTEVYFRIGEGEDKNLIRRSKRAAISPALIKFLEATFGESCWDFM